MSDFELVWLKRWDGAVCPPQHCPHPTTEVLSINQRLESTVRGQHKIAMDGAICMNCGSDRQGHLGLIEGLSRCWDEHHLRPGVADRLYDLAASNEEALWAEGKQIPMWMMFAFGWTGREIVEALNSGELVAA